MMEVQVAHATPEQQPAPGDGASDVQDSEQAASYMLDMLVSLRGMAAAHDHAFLAYLIEMAAMEASGLAGDSRRAVKATGRKPSTRRRD